MYTLDITFCPVIQSKQIQMAMFLSLFLYCDVTFGLSKLHEIVENMHKYYIRIYNRVE